MLKLRFSLIVFALVAAVPAVAQAAASQGLKAGYIATMFTGEVLPGQMDKFKELAAKVIAAETKEPGTLVYVWSLRPDLKTYDTVEVYEDSDALVAHGKHIVGEFGKELAQVRKPVSFVVFGSPSAQAKQALAGLHPVYETPIDGFVR
jgi:quinol monooxygenase YgiN